MALKTDLKYSQPIEIPGDYGSNCEACFYCQYIVIKYIFKKQLSLCIHTRQARVIQMSILLF